MPKIIDDYTIFQKSIQKLIEKGYAGATTKTIAAEVGISEVTLFRRYGNKSELIKRAVKSAVETSAFNSASSFTGDVEADLLRVVIAYQELADRGGRFLPALIAEIPRYPELSDLLETPYDMVNKIGKLIVVYQNKGILKQEHPVHAVAGLLGPLNIASMIQQVPTKQSFPPFDPKTHVRHYLSGRVISESRQTQGLG